MRPRNHNNALGSEIWLHTLLVNIIGDVKKLNGRGAKSTKEFFLSGKPRFKMPILSPPPGSYAYLYI